MVTSNAYDSRARFLAQLERCVKHQKELAIPEGIPIGAPETFVSGESLPEEPMGGGQPYVHCEVEFPSALGQPQTLYESGCA